METQQGKLGALGAAGPALLTPFSFAPWDSFALQSFVMADGVKRCSQEAGQDPQTHFTCELGIKTPVPGAEKGFPIQC